MTKNTSFVQSIQDAGYPALHLWFRIAWRQTLAAGLLAAFAFGGAMILVAAGLTPLMGILPIFFALLLLAPGIFLAMVVITIWIIKRPAVRRPFQRDGRSFRFVWRRRRDATIIEPTWGNAGAVYWGIFWRGLVLNGGILIPALLFPHLLLLSGAITNYLAILWFLVAPQGTLRISPEPEGQGDAESLLPSRQSESRGNPSDPEQT